MIKILRLSATRLPTLFLTLLLLLGSFPAAADSGGTITGVLTDVNGTPVAGVCVWLGPVHLDSNCTLTDAAGRYTIAGLPLGLTWPITYHKPPIFNDVDAGNIAVTTTTPVDVSRTLPTAPGQILPPAPLPVGPCVLSSVGPGIPPPTQVRGKEDGFHTQWWGQSGYMTMCPGDTLVATVAYRNTGSRGWVSGAMGQVAYLGTWGPEPGQDRASLIGGDGTLGSPATGWPRYNRIALQPAPYVGPDMVSWFQFTVKAPTTQGTYRLALRPLVEGAQWMEDYGVFWVVTVQAR